MDYRLRPELDEENTKRIGEWVRRLREEHGIELSPNRLVNLIVSSMEGLEIDQVFTLTLLERESGKTPEDSKKKRLRRRRTLRIGI